MLPEAESQRQPFLWGVHHIMLPKFLINNFIHNFRTNTYQFIYELTVSNLDKIRTSWLERIERIYMECSYVYKIIPTEAIQNKTNHPI